MNYLYDTKNPQLLSEIQHSFPQASEILALESFYKIMGDATRLRLLLSLLHHELCVSDLCNIVEMSRSAVSHQLATLKEAHLVKATKIGKTVYYALDDEHVNIILDMAMTHLREGRKQYG